MGSSNVDPELTTIVRRYSEKVAEDMPNNSVAQALGVWEEQEKITENQGIDWRDWLRFEEHTDDRQLLDLEKQCQEVAETWRAFKLHCHNVKFLEGIDKPPSIHTLQKEVWAAHNKWEGKKEKGFGKAKDNVMTFLEMLDGHKALFSVIPSNDKYLSLFTGVVSSVVKASVNYEQIANGFSQALADISVDLNFVRKSTLISDSDDIKAAIIELYVQVFKLLCDMMIWYQSRGKRFRTAFDVRYYDKKVEEKVTKIRRQIKRVERQVTMETAANVQTTKQDMKALLPRLESVLRELADESRHEFRESLELKFRNFSQQFQYQVGLSAANLLVANAEVGLQDPRTGRIIKDGVVTLDPDKSREQPIANVMSNHESGMDDGQTREQLKIYCQTVRGFAEDDHDRLAKEPSNDARPNIPEETIIEVGKWTKFSDTCSFIWVEGSGYHDCDSPLALMAYHIYRTAMDKGLPAISFFSKPRYELRNKSTTTREAGLVALLYWLIEQLRIVVPEKFEASSALDQTKFESLDGSRDSIATALEIIQALLDLAPPRLIVVLVGLETIESQETIQDLAKLVKLLMKQGTKTPLKVIFTTSGRCVTLEKLYERGPPIQRVDASRLAQRRPGTLLAGGRSANDLSFS
ncbi:hypothetical protein F5B20DRAFT_578745 [Whalleya microplaca]|nr:hypothetical protein F5B20DRAFT_578745 [Whalleya microplaca]